MEWSITPRCSAWAREIDTWHAWKTSCDRTAWVRACPIAREAAARASLAAACSDSSHSPRERRVDRLWLSVCCASFSEASRASCNAATASRLLDAPFFTSRNSASSLPWLLDAKSGLKYSTSRCRYATQLQASSPGFMRDALTRSNVSFAIIVPS